MELGRGSLLRHIHHSTLRTTNACASGRICAGRFLAVESFRAKLNVVDSAVKMRCRNLPETLALWDTLYKRAREKNNKRNALAHGTVMNFGRPDETYYVPSMAKTMLEDIAKIPA